MINSHKVIGVCVTRVQYSAESIYLNHLNEAAAKLGYKVMVFNSVATTTNYYEEGARSVYSLINHDIIDVLVILSSTFTEKEIEKRIESQFDYDRADLSAYTVIVNEVDQNAFIEKVLDIAKKI